MSDNLQPNVLRIGPNGEIHVHADGFDLDAATVVTEPPPSQDSIQWLRVNDGAMIAHIIGYSIPPFLAAPGVEILTLRATANPYNDQSEVDISATGADGGVITNEPLALLHLERDPNPGGVTEITAQAVDNAGNSFVTRIIDMLGRSSFIQLAAPDQQLAVAVGQADVTWDGTAPLATVTDIPHLLPRVPKVILATMQAAGQGVVIPCHAGNQTDTTFDLQAEWMDGFIPAADTVITAMWAVIG